LRPNFPSPYYLSTPLSLLKHDENHSLLPPRVLAWMPRSEYCQPSAGHMRSRERYRYLCLVNGLFKPIFPSVNCYTQPNSTPVSLPCDSILDHENSDSYVAAAPSHPISSTFILHDIPGIPESLLSLVETALITLEERSILMIKGAKDYYFLSTIVALVKSRLWPTQANIYKQQVVERVLSFAQILFTRHMNCDHLGDKGMGNFKNNQLAAFMAAPTMVPVMQPEFDSNGMHPPPQSGVMVSSTSSFVPFFHANYEFPAAWRVRSVPGDLRLGGSDKHDVSLLSRGFERDLTFYALYDICLIFLDLLCHYHCTYFFLTEYP
jgi:hypothetical protein